MEDKIKCGGGIFEEMKKHTRTVIFTGKPMTEREFKISTRKVGKENSSMKSRLDFIRKILYEKKL